MNGVHTCVASVNNETGSIYITLDVTVPPTISGTVPVTISNGSAVLTCSGSGNPTPQIEWTLPGSTVINAARFVPWSIYYDL